MLIKLREDSLGNVTARPVNEKIAATIIRDAKKNGAPDWFDAEVFMQQPSLYEVVETFGPRALWRGQVNDGAIIRCDRWTFRQYCGYSAN